VLALAVLMVGTETAIVSNAYFIAGASVLLAGGVAVGGSDPAHERRAVRSGQRVGAHIVLDAAAADLNESV
jgi:hypothetical protein